MIKNVSEPSRVIAQYAYFGLLAWVAIWHSFLAPHPEINPLGLTVAWVLPLLFPIRGILAKKPYTFAWANFVLLLYFLHSLTMIYVDEGERWLAVVELILVSIAFTASTIFSRMRGKELGLRIKKLSELSKEEAEKFGKKKS